MICKKHNKEFHGALCSECAKERVFDSPQFSGSVDFALNRKTAIFNVLVGRCGQTLTPDNVDSLLEEIVSEMEKGGCSWAFQQNDQINRPEKAKEE